MERVSTAPGVRPLLAVVPARGGSKGLPGKNVRSLHGLPLIAHSIGCARLSPEIDRLVVSTDSEEIAAVARAHGADVPFLRPAELASDTAAMWPVIKHALRATEEIDGVEYASVLLLDPTSPGRLPLDIANAVRQLESDPAAVGVIGVSEPDFNPLWYCVVNEGGYMSDLVPGANRYARRQDVPPVYKINGTLYLWRREHVLTADDWRTGRLLMEVIPQERAINIDVAAQFEQVSASLDAGTLDFPWLA
jgi:N-acylneuraminate cytidylyltransferase